MADSVPTPDLAGRAAKAAAMCPMTRTADEESVIGQALDALAGWERLVPHLGDLTLPRAAADIADAGVLPDGFTVKVDIGIVIERRGRFFASLGYHQRDPKPWLLRMDDGQVNYPVGSFATPLDALAAALEAVRGDGQ